jgi:hypothetical protein
MSSVPLNKLSPEAEMCKIKILGEKWRVTPAGPEGVMGQQGESRLLTAGLA